MPYPWGLDPDTYATTTLHDTRPTPELEPWTTNAPPEWAGATIHTRNDHRGNYLIRRSNAGPEWFLILRGDTPHTWTTRTLADARTLADDPARPCGHPYHHLIRREPSYIATHGECAYCTPGSTP